MRQSVVPTLIRIFPRVKDRLCTYCVKHGFSINRVVQEAIIEFLETHDREHGPGYVSEEVENEAMFSHMQIHQHNYRDKEEANKDAQQVNNGN